MDLRLEETHLNQLTIFYRVLFFLHISRLIEAALTFMFRS
jgi:hypothetical protein